MPDGGTALPSAGASALGDAGGIGVIGDAAVSSDSAAPGADTDGGLGTGYEALAGWAAVSGDGVATTTGGEGGTTVTPSTVDELIDYAESDEPLVIEISGTFKVPRLQLSSNKTLVGVGTAAVIEGGLRIRGDEDAFVTNVIVRNLRVNAASSDVDGDGIQIYYAHHVWIDHCDIHDAPDGNLDVVHASNWVTISWTRFHYTSAAPEPDHRFSNLIGHTDGNDEDVERLKVSFHHCHWSEGVIERMPRVRYGDVHVWNSLFTAPGNNYAIGAGWQSRLRIEHNVFDGVSDPHVFYDAEPTAEIAAVGNDYRSTSGLMDMGQGASFTPPYAYMLRATVDVSAAVLAGAGPQ